MITQLKNRIGDYQLFHHIKNYFQGFQKKKYKINLNPDLNRTHRNYYIISKSPLIISTSEHIRDIELFSEIIGKEKTAYFLITFWWTLFDGPTTFDEVIANYNQQTAKYPNHKLILLGNTIEEFKVFKKQNIPCHFINQNCLVDKNLFKPIQSLKHYDVIYNARLELLKRHNLLKQVKNIGLISALVHQINTKKENYLNHIKGLIPQAKILNFSPPLELGNFNFESSIPQLDSSQICSFINQSKVGVILSAKEGACYASMEYLLCGIPVVSTKNLGGRNVFFDKRYCQIVNSTEKDVKNAVDALIAKNISPEFIRNETLKKMEPHLEKYKAVIKDIFTHEGIALDISTFWDQAYTNKMIKYANVFPKQFIKDLN